jgi:hypothetical protein
MWDIVITTADKRTFRYPAVNTGPSLIEMLGVPSVTLGKSIPLNNGTTYRSFRFIGPETKHVDLSEYQNLFLATREWLGCIEPV